MNARFIVVAALTLIGVFGLSMSGCNRDRNTMVSANSRRSGQNRPAEVLSASAYRPPRSHQSAYQHPPKVVAMQESVFAVQPPMRPVSTIPIPELAMARAKFDYSASQLSRATPGRTPVSTTFMPPVMTMVAPIPELEPRRYIQPVAAGARLYRPAEIMVSPAAPPIIASTVLQGNSSREINNALAPIAPTPFSEGFMDGKWISSPNTAMRR